MGRRVRKKAKAKVTNHMMGKLNSTTGDGRVRDRSTGHASLLKPRFVDSVRRAAHVVSEIERAMNFIVPLLMANRYKRGESTSDFFEGSHDALQAIQCIIAPPLGGVKITDPTKLKRIAEFRAVLAAEAPNALTLNLSGTGLWNVVEFMERRSLTNLKNTTVANYTDVVEAWMLAAYKRDHDAAAKLSAGRELTAKEFAKRCRGLTSALLARRERNDYPADVTLNWGKFLPADHFVSKSANGLTALRESLEAAAASEAGGALWKYHECLAWLHTRTVELGGVPNAAAYPFPPDEPIPSYQRFDAKALVELSPDEVVAPLGLTKQSIISPEIGQGVITKRRAEILSLFVDETSSIFGASTPIAALSSVLTNGVRAHGVFGEDGAGAPAAGGRPRRGGSGRGGRGGGKRKRKHGGSQD